MEWMGTIGAKQETRRDAARQGLLPGEPRCKGVPKDDVCLTSLYMEKCRAAHSKKYTALDSIANSIVARI